eukprot:TRINITY_DN114_c0_g1_i4.p4 TRINITY_DN114_c0_g1~~TRINITY_DN114_c0_g1_i4.p4  ORF type:complete len:101 (+),score=1.69 TRINITY_DN114_c0_g1_i4:5092-5394(+)
MLFDFISNSNFFSSYYSYLSYSFIIVTFFFIMIFFPFFFLYSFTKFIFSNNKINNFSNLFSFNINHINLFCSFDGIMNSYTISFMLLFLFFPITFDIFIF